LGAAAILGFPRPVAAEPPPETKSIRLVADQGMCLVPMFLAEELLRLEGFEEIEYVPMDFDKSPSNCHMVAAGKADLTQDGAICFIPLIDRKESVAVLSGVHVGCWELFGGPHVHAIRDLKGKRISISGPGTEEHLVLSSLLAYMGLDPRKDIQFVVIPLYEDQLKAFASGAVDAIFAFPPQPQRLRAERIGHVVIDSTLDRPWNQYFCCAVGANQDFVVRNPVATKRALRAFLKAADVCAQDPQRAARYLVAKNLEPHYETALEVLTKVPYGRWRDFNPEDTLRFHALRLHEAGMIKSNPNTLIAQGTDWRFLNELKRELKA
jgi:NitT/TauT family transport system substrate-binding protein